MNIKEFEAMLSKPTEENNNTITGLVEKGNIDLTNRPVVTNEDGSISTVRSMSINMDGKEILIPTVSSDGKILSDEDAITNYKKTGQHLGIFNNPNDASIYAEQLHKDQEDLYNSPAEKLRRTQRQQAAASAYSPTKSSPEPESALLNVFKGIEGDDTFIGNIGRSVYENTSIGYSANLIRGRNEGQEDPNFDPDNLPEKLRASLHTGLDTMDKQYLYDNFSYNEETYRKGSQLLKETKERKQRIEEFAQKNPGAGITSMMAAVTVLEPLNWFDGGWLVGAVNGARKSYMASKVTQRVIAEMLDKDTFTAVNAAYKTAKFAPLNKARQGTEVIFNELARAGKVVSWNAANPKNPMTYMGAVLAGETVSQGAIEFLRAYDQDDDFDIDNYVFGILVGSGVSAGIPFIKATNTYQNVRKYLGKGIDTVKSVRFGYDESTIGRMYSTPMPIYLARKDMNKFVDVVADQHNNEKAVKVAQIIRQEVDNIFEGWKQNKVMEKTELINNFERGKERYNILKGKKKLTPDESLEFKNLKKINEELKGKLKHFDADYKAEEDLLNSGKHPLYSSDYKGEITPDYLAKNIEGLDIKDVETDEALSNFLFKDKVLNFEVRFAKTTPIRMAILKKMRQNVDNAKITSAGLINKGLDAIENSAMLDNALMRKMKKDHYINAVRQKVTNPDSIFSRFYFTASSQVNSDNEVLAGLADLAFSDNLGRVGMSTQSLFGNKDMYFRMLYGDFMKAYRTAIGKFENEYKTVGSKLYNQYINIHNLETNFNKMLNESYDAVESEFVSKYGQKLWDITEEFREAHFKLSKTIEDALKKKGVAGAEGFTAYKNGRHVQWDFAKFRRFAEPSPTTPGKFIPKETFLVEVRAALKSGLSKIGKELSEEQINKIAYQWANGMVNLEWKSVELATINTMKAIEDLVAKTAGTEGGEIVAEAHATMLARAEKFLMKEMNQKTPLDMDMLVGGKKLNEYQDGNFLSTQIGFINRMSAKLGAADLDILDVDSIDEIVEDVRLRSIELANDPSRVSKLDTVEKTEDYINHQVELAKDIVDEYRYGTSIEKNKAKFKGDVKSFYKYLANATETGMLFASPLLSIQDVGFAVAQSGSSNFLKRIVPTVVKTYRSLYSNDFERLDRMSRDVITLGGFGNNKYLTGAVGFLGDEAVADGVPLVGHFEQLLQAVKNLGSRIMVPVEQSAVLVSARMFTYGWHEHAMGLKNNVIDIMLGSNKISSRMMENLGLGKIVDGKLVHTDDYKAMIDIFTNKVDVDENGVMIGFKELSFEERTIYNRVVGNQMMHSMATPDPGVQFEIQKHPIGAILYQFTSYGFNVAQKVAGFMTLNAFQGAQRGDYLDAVKWGQALFWTTALGTLAHGVKNLERDVGKDKNSNSYRRYKDSQIPWWAAGAVSNPLTEKAFGIALSTADMLGMDPMKYGFNKSIESSMNLANTPMGTTVLNAVRLGENAYKATLGDDPQGNAGAKTIKYFLKLNPMKNIPGVKSINNFLTPNTDPKNSGNDN